MYRIIFLSKKMFFLANFYKIKFPMKSNYRFKPNMDEDFQNNLH